MPSSDDRIVVVDASFFVDFFLGEVRLGARIDGFELHAPVSVDAELVHALRRKWFAGLITDVDARSAIRLLDSYEITRHPVIALKTRMWALRQNLTAYDAAYVALAEVLDAPLVTRDYRLSRSAGHAARIEYID
jgi:predicted nucleic acid-binding protein